MPSKPPPPPPPLGPPPASRRQGPRPLPLHLAAASFAWTSSLAALPLLRNGSLALRPELAAQASLLAGELAAADPEALATAVAEEARRRFGAFLDAVGAYRRHPFKRAEATAPVLWQEGTTRLLDYRAPDAAGAPVLVVPSLINRGYILDLLAERSFMRFLAAQGFRPFLIDWQAPGEAERRFGLGDYVLGRMARALDAVIAACGRNGGRKGGRKPILLGYCMG